MRKIFFILYFGLLIPQVTQAISHQLNFGGGISLMDVNESGAGYGANVGYRVAPIAEVPLGFGLDISALRFDTANTGDGTTGLFGDNSFDDMPSNLSVINFLVRVDYTVLDTSFFSLSPGLAAGQAMTIETRRDSTPSGTFSPISSDTRIRTAIALSLDMAFKLNAETKLVLRPQYQFIGSRKFFSPVVGLVTEL